MNINYNINYYQHMVKLAADGAPEPKEESWDKPSVGGVIGAAATGAAITPATKLLGRILSSSALYNPAHKIKPKQLALGQFIENTSMGALNNAHASSIRQKYADKGTERMLKRMQKGKGSISPFLYADVRELGRTVGTGAFLGTGIYGLKKLFNYIRRNKDKE